MVLLPSVNSIKRPKQCLYVGTVQHVFCFLLASSFLSSLEIRGFSDYWCVFEGDRKGSDWVGGPTVQKATCQKGANYKRQGPVPGGLWAHVHCLCAIKLNHHQKVKKCKHTRKHKHSITYIS